jgi:hypothetical protein
MPECSQTELRKHYVLIIASHIHLSHFILDAKMKLWALLDLRQNNCYACAIAITTIVHTTLIPV